MTPNNSKLHITSAMAAMLAMAPTGLMESLPSLKTPRSREPFSDVDRKRLADAQAKRDRKAASRAKK